MYKYAIVVIFALFVAASAKPEVVAAPLAYTAPAAPAPYVTATSSQVIARNFNGVAAAAAPVVAARYTAPFTYASSQLVASPYAAAPLAAYAAPAPFQYAAPYVI